MEYGIGWAEDLARSQPFSHLIGRQALRPYAGRMRSTGLEQIIAITVIRPGPVEWGLSPIHRPLLTTPTKSTALSDSPWLMPPCSQMSHAEQPRYPQRS